jgi:DNA-binding transcriptional LysR family regulator
METRQLKAFCEVIECKSFSQAAGRLGVTQPAVSLQMRTLEKRLGVQLLDRSGRRVEPTEAGLRLYRGAQRLLHLEEEIVNDLADELGGDLTGSLEIGASTGPGGGVLPKLLCEFGALHPDLRIALYVFDTQTVVERVADRTLEVGVVGAAPRHRGVEYEPFFRDTVVLACPPGHRFAGRTVSFDELRRETLLVMQDGAGVRQMIEDELRNLGTRLRDLDVHFELGLQESVTTAVRNGYGVTFISRSSVESDLAAGTLVEARVAGMELEREIFLVRATGRSETTAARAFVEFARGRLSRDA